jgi:hypothetical protein
LHLALLLVAATETASASGSLLIGHALAGGTWNPRAGALFVGLRDHRVYHRSEQPIFDKLAVDYGGELLLSASFRPALYVEWLPLAILKIRVQYEFWTWTGLHLGLGHGLTFDGRDAPFDEDTLRMRKGEERANIGHRLLLLPTLQLKVWRIVLVDNFEVAGWFVHGGERGQYWYDSIDDNLIRKGAVDGTLKNQLILGAIPWDGEGDAQLLIAGVHDFVRTFSARIPRHRLSLLVAYTFLHDLWGMSRPTILTIGGANLRDRNRQYEFFALLGIRVELELHP